MLLSLLSEVSRCLWRRFWRAPRYQQGGGGSGVTLVDGVLWCVVWFGGLGWCVVWFGGVWCGGVWCGMVWCGMVWWCVVCVWCVVACGVAW